MGKTVVVQGAAYVTSDGEAARARVAGEARRRALNPRGQDAPPRVMQVSVIARMAEAGHLRAEQLRAGQEIEAYWHAWTAGLFAAGGGYGERLDKGVSAAEPPSVRARGERYRAWASWAEAEAVQGSLTTLQVVLDVVVDGKSFEVLRHRYRMGPPRLRRVVQVALRRYAVMSGWVEDRTGLIEAA